MGLSGKGVRSMIYDILPRALFHGYISGSKGVLLVGNGNLTNECSYETRF